MEWNKHNLRGWLLVVCGGVAFYCVLQNLGVVASAVMWVLGILTPFILGGAIAFVLNVPMRAIERHLYPTARRGGKLRRPLALVLTLLAVIAVLTLASTVIGPGIAEAVSSALDQMPAAFDRAQEWVNGLAVYLPQLQDFLAELAIDWGSVSHKALQLAQDWGAALLSSGGGFIGGVVSGVSTFLIALIFSFYILLQKERLARQARQVLYALLPERGADRTLEILRLTGRTFSSFLSGQCLEAVILGTLFVVSMSILRMPYALLVGVLIALTALIPIVGAFIGCAVGALLILMVDPVKALVFRNGTLRATFFRDIWRVEKVRKNFDQREVEIIKGILDDGVREGVFSMPDTDITALVLHYALKGLEVPYIRGVMGDNISQRIKRRDNVMNLIFNGIRIK